MKRAVAIVMISIAALLSACDSNPLIGKWRSATDSLPCRIAGTLEFTEKMVLQGGLAAPITYSRDGARYIAAAGNGAAFVFEKAGDDLKMVSPFECRMVKINEETLAITLAEGAACYGLTDTFASSDVTDRIKRSMSASDKPLDDRAFEAAARSNEALQRLVREKTMTNEALEKAFASGEAQAKKIGTYGEMKKRLDACDKTISELAKLAAMD